VSEHFIVSFWQFKTTSFSEHHLQFLIRWQWICMQYLTLCTVLYWTLSAPQRILDKHVCFNVLQNQNVLAILYKLYYDNSQHTDVNLGWQEQGSKDGKCVRKLVLEKNVENTQWMAKRTNLSIWEQIGRKSTFENKGMWRKLTYLRHTMINDDSL